MEKGCQEPEIGISETCVKSYLLKQVLFDFSSFFVSLSRRIRLKNSMKIWRTRHGSTR